MEQGISFLNIPKSEKFPGKKPGVGDSDLGSLSSAITDV